ncbi:MAG: MarR family transcriptional regulator [Cyclobacteriaceae bacterium]|nr:MarR family transcriptional regulator [Cyclobacteriaceae bacterium]
MKLEQAIKQFEFESRGQRLGVNLIYTSNWVQERQKSYFSKFGITQQQYNALRILRGNYPKPYSTSDIRERMLDKMSDASRIVERLVKKDLVVRKINKKDKRLVDVTISDSGLDLLEKIDKTIENFVQRPFSNLTEKEQEILDSLLDKVRA